MSYEFVLVEKEDGVAILTLNRPEKVERHEPAAQHRTAGCGSHYEPG